MSLTVNFTGAAALSSETAPTGVVTDVGQKVPYGFTSKMGIMKSRVDTSKTGGTNTSSDVYEAILIPAGFKVLSAWFYVVTAEATNTTLQLALGDGGSTAGYVSAATVAAIALHGPTDGAAYTANGGKFYSAADTIDILCAVVAATNVIVDVYALVVDCNP